MIVIQEMESQNNNAKEVNNTCTLFILIQTIQQSF